MADNSGYKLTKQWFDFCKSGTHLVRPIHTALYLYCLQLCNSLKWKVNFGLPTESTMGILGIKNKDTYYTALNDLCRFGFVIMAEKSINQHTANIIRLPKKPISTPISTPVSTPVSTVPIVKRIKPTENVLNDFQVVELKTALFKIFCTVRNDIPHEALMTEAGKFITKYGVKDIRKDINLINTWAVKINYSPQPKLEDEFTKTAQRNKEKYGG